MRRPSAASGDYFHSRLHYDVAVVPWRNGGDIVARLRKSRKLIGKAERTAPSGAASDCDGSFSLEPERLFSRPAPLEVEIGAGKGDFILQRAARAPQHNFLAIELAGSVFQWLAIRIQRSGLENLRAIRADARPVVNLMLPAASVRTFHIYFPDPWPKSRHSKHRLFTPALVGGLMRCLEPEGRIYVATDVDWYFEYIAGLFAACGFCLSGNGASGARSTGFGRRFANAGKVIHAGCFRTAGAVLTIDEDLIQRPEVS